MKQRVRDYFGKTMLLFWAISLSITIAINSSWLYKFSITKFHITEWTHLSKEQLLQNYHILLDYLNKFWIKELSLPDFSLSPFASIHFQEVKVWFQVNYGLCAITTLLGFFYLVRIKKEDRLQTLSSFFIKVVAVATVLIILVVTQFSRIFVIFHKILFANDYWIFDPVEDNIIQALPSDFFLYSFVLALSLFLILSVMFIFLHRFKRRRSI